MSKLREVTSPVEFLQLLESSRLLDPEALSRARAAASESANCRSLAREFIREGWLTMWQAGQLLMGVNRFHLGKYVLRSQIGRGDFGRVFLAFHPQLERDVAIKTLSRRFTQRPDIVERFLADARKAAALDHPHVLHVYDFGSDEGRFFIVMEPIAGDDLRHHVEAHGPLPIKAVTQMLTEAAVGLAHAHERGVLHQTLQPASCMLDAQGSLKIVGFGMGRLAQADRLIPASDIPPTQIAWRAAFTAPEQQSEEAVGDARGDLYALGCIAYFALTGQVPDGAGSDREVAGVARQLLEQRAEVPSGLAELIGRLMASQPQDRFASAAELGQAMQGLVESLAGERPAQDTGSETTRLDAFDWVPDGDEAGRAARRENRLRRSAPALATVPRLRSRSRWLGFYIALILAGLIIGAAVVYWLTRPPARETATLPGGPPRVRVAGSTKPDAQPAATRDESSSNAAPVNPARDAESSENAPPAGDGSDEAPADGMDTLGTADAKPKPDSPQPTENSSGPASSNDMPPASPVPGTTDPSVPGTESPKPTAPPPTESAKPAPTVPDSPPVNPFEGWSEVLDLLSPDTEAAEPMRGTWDIGKWRRSPGAPIEVALLGGSQAGLSAARFELTTISDGEMEGWELAAVEDQAGSPVRHLVARVSSPAERLQIAWDPGAPEYAEAGCLANCVLRFTSGTFRHDLRLRKPVEADSLQLSLKKQPDAERVKIVAAPPAAQIRFQVTSIDEPLPRTFSITPVDPVALEGTVVRVGFGEDVAKPVLLLDLKPELKHVFQLQGEIFFRLVTTEEPVLWAAKKFQNVAINVAANQESANIHAQGLRNRLILLGAKDPARATLAGELKLADARLAECSQVTRAVEWLAATRDAMAKGGAIHYRLFLLVEDCEVELVRSR